MDDRTKRSGWARLMKSLAITAGAVVALAGSNTALAFNWYWDQGHDATYWDQPYLTPGQCQLSPLCNVNEDCNGVSTGSPVIVATGALTWTEGIASVPGKPALNLQLTYNAHDPSSGMFGNGWSSGCEVRLTRTVEQADPDAEDSEAEEQFTLRTGSGKRYTYKRDNDGGFDPPAGREETLSLLPEEAQGEAKLTNQDGTTRTFDAAGRLIRVERPNGQFIAYDYDGEGRLTRQKTTGNRYFDFSYNANGRVSRVTDNAGRSWQFRYDGDGNLTSITDPTGGVREFSYESFNGPNDTQTYHLLTEVEDATDVTAIAVEYDDQGRVDTYTVGENTFDYSYDTANQTASKTDSTGAQWQYQYNADGVIVSQTNPAGETWQFSYDSDGNRVSQTDPLGNKTEYSYDGQKRRLSATDALGNKTQWEYGEEGTKPTAIVSPTGRRTEIQYNESFQPTQVTDPADSVTQMSYDTNGYLQSVTDPKGQTTTVTSNGAGQPTRITDELGRTTQMRYDAAGNVTSVTAPDGATTQYSYDGLRRVTSITKPSGDTIQFSYDDAGRRTAVTDGKGQTTTFAYDDHGRLSKRTRPDGRATEYAYRSDNRLKRIDFADGSTTSYSYDDAKRVTRIDADGDVRTFTYTERGNIAKASNDVGTVTRQYDALGRLTQETVNGETVQYRYNAESELTGYTALGTSVDYQRTDRGQVATINAPEGSYQFSYDALGRRTQLTMPHGEQVAFNYNAASELTSQVFNGPHDARYDYSYDAAGRVTRWQGPDFDWRYGYNADGELTSATDNSANLGNFNYAYDAAGNRIEGGQRYDNTNRLLESSNFTYSYNARGQRTKKTDKGDGSVVNYAYNGRGRLASLKPSDGPDKAFAYGPLGRRWERSVGGNEQEFVYAGQNRIATLDASDNVTEEVTFGPGIDSPLAVKAGGNTRYLHSDRLGSVMAASTSGGTAATYRYSPYGQQLEGSAGSGAFRFTGRESESSGLSYHRARYLDTTQGRFLREDPIGFNGGQANLYGYALNTPTNAIDGTGETALFIRPTPIIRPAVRPTVRPKPRIRPKADRVPTRRVPKQERTRGPRREDLTKDGLREEVRQPERPVINQRRKDLFELGDAIKAIIESIGGGIGAVGGFLPGIGPNNQAQQRQGASFPLPGPVGPVPPGPPPNGACSNPRA